MCFKENSQLVRVVSPLLSTDWWNYCIQRSQFSHALTQDIAKISMNFEYIWYKLCVLIGVTKRLISHTRQISVIEWSTTVDIIPRNLWHAILSWNTSFTGVIIKLYYRFCSFHIISLLEFQFKNIFPNVPTIYFCNPMLEI